MFRSAGRRFDRIATIARGALLLLVLLVGASARAAEASGRGVLGRGTAWETSYFVQTSDRAGPTVVISGGVHGDEPAGAAAAEQIRHWPIVRGTLVVLPCANPPALAARTRTIPGAPASQNNLNRNFPRAGQADAPPLGEQAAAIWQWLQALQPAWVVDLHEGYGIRAAGSPSVGSSVIVGPEEGANEAVERMLAAVNATIDREDKRFVRLGPPVNGSLARAAAEQLGARAMILETSKQDLPVAASAAESQPKPAAKPQPVYQPLSRRMRQHRLLVHALLTHLEMIDAALDADRIAGRAAGPGQTWVALYDAGGTGGQGVPAVNRILGGEGMRVVPIGAEEIAAGSLDEFDVAVFPGGSGSKQAAAIGSQGRERVRQFLERGGGYLGICAGAYLCTSGFDWGLKVLDAKTVSPRWQRGAGMLEMELTPAGRDVLGDHPAPLEVRYHNGPVITRAEVEAVPDYEVWAYYRTEVAKNDTPAGVMIDSPAIAAGRFGQGRILFVSPHPEQTPGLEGLVHRGVRWAAGKAEQDAQ